MFEFFRGRSPIAVTAGLIAAAVACRDQDHARAAPEPARPPGPVEVSFPSGSLTLRGLLYRPAGAGRFPAVLYNHGSAPGMRNNQAFEAIGARFAARGWVFFAPYRRGQGLSASAGPYIGDQIEAAERAGGAAAGSAAMVKLLETDHLDDQLAALAWLRAAPFVDPERIAAAGNSFGGIETVLGVERASYCAGIDAAGGAQSWSRSPELQAAMLRAVRAARAPIFFFQAENDFDTTPTRALSAAMEEAGKQARSTIYPAFGSSPKDGHAFAYQGSEIWFPDAIDFLQRTCR